MNVLIIGYGSIGKRHEEVLFSINEIEKIDIVTKQKLQDKNTFESLEDIKNLDKYDYFVIASETHKHFDQLKYLENKVSDKLFFCEKPLFDKVESLCIKKNKVYIGYVLRFHPLLARFKESLINETIISVHVNCGQYLPTWRKSDYKDSYSAKKSLGGGVLLDLSHEIDYVQWLFGEMIDIKSFQAKISDLEIDSDDLTMLIAKTNNNIYINISLDYISKITSRKMIVHTLNSTFELDFISNILTQKNKENIEQSYVIKNLDRNFMFKLMHQSIFENKENTCTYKEALSVMQTIQVIQKQNI